MPDLCRRDFLNFGAAAFANIAAFSTLGYAASRAFGKPTPDPALPVGGPGANTTGQYGPVIGWPLIALSAVLLPSGAVMSFGSLKDGTQGGYIHDIWDPRLGTGPASHFTSPNAVQQDFFCSSASVQTNGTVLIADGDRTISGVRNYSNDLSSVFNPRTNILAAGPPTGIARWYGSFVSLPNGEKAIFGGRASRDSQNGSICTPSSITPQITNLGRAWISLPGAASAAAFGCAGTWPIENWAYPRANVIPGGKIAVFTNDGLIFLVDPSGAGSIKRVGGASFHQGGWYYPTISYSPGKWLSVRQSRVVLKLEFATNGWPTVTRVGNLDQDRQWGNATLLADGRVLVNGGSTVYNQLIGVAYRDTIWDPATEKWTPGATAKVARLYHNSSLLLTDGTVLTAGGGAPGPLTNLNAQIYYPSYLFALDGTLAVRPSLVVSPTLAAFGSRITGTVGKTDRISRITALRLGSTTHDYNSDAIFLQLAFAQSGSQLEIQIPADPTIVIQGFWMIFAWNSQGVPSRASVIRIY